MEFKDFLNDFKNLSDNRVKNINEIKNRGLPVVVFGAANMAESITKELNFLGVEIYGYAVDDNYYREGAYHLDKPIYRFSELRRQPDKYIFVLGISDINDRFNELMNDDEIICYGFYHRTTEHVDFNKVLKDMVNFSETYSWLNDDKSREIMIDYVRSNISGDVEYTHRLKGTPHDQYFNDVTATAFTTSAGGGMLTVVLMTAIQ